jgi:hypothetical protein
MQLRPSFKVGVLKVRPMSKLVMMRLPSPQRAQSPLNLQVAFEVVKIQPVAGALGTIRVVPSQQQRPAMGGMPSFAVAGLQIVSNSENCAGSTHPVGAGARICIHYRAIPDQHARVFSDTRNWIGYTEFKFETGCRPVARDRARSSRRRANVRDR